MRTFYAKLWSFPTNTIFHPAHVAGLFFCLASADGAGLFCYLSHSTAHDTRPTQAAIIPPAPRWSVHTRPDALHQYQMPAPCRALYRSAQPPYYNKVYKGAAYRRPCQPGGVQLLPYAEHWQALTACQQYRPGAPAEGSASPPVQGQLGGGLDASHARRLAIWHRVSGQGAPGQSGTLHPAGQSRSMGAAGGAEPLTATAVAFFGLSPDS